MKKIKLYVAVSLDGFIAGNDGSLDRLSGYGSQQGKADYKNVLDSVDTVIMGSNTYHDLFVMEALWSFREKDVYVVTHNPAEERQGIKFITEDVTEKIAMLRNEAGKDILLAGGGKITTLLLNNDLLDEMIITYIPVILGSGIRLFPDGPKESKWTVKECKSLDSNILKVTYSLA